MYCKYIRCCSTVLRTVERREKLFSRVSFLTVFDFERTTAAQVVQYLQYDMYVVYVLQN
jgi:hypothetical protein